jgi:hypothetical protein
MKAVSLPIAEPAVFPGGGVVADTIAETVDLLYTIDQEHLTPDQQIALAGAMAALAQAERLDQISERLRSIHQVLNTFVMRSSVDGGR